MPRIEAAPKTGRIIRYLQGWIGIVGFMAFGNTLSCFLGHDFLSNRLYTGAPEQINPLSARLFGTWTLLSAILRVYCSFNIRNKPVYNLTFGSFVLAFAHFTSEIFYFKSCKLDSPGVIAPILVSGLSIVSMAVGYSYLEQTQLDPREEHMKGKYSELIRNSKKST